MKTLFKTMFTMMTLLIISIPFVSCGDDDEPETGIYAGQKWVGNWQGEDEATEWYITLGDNGEYSDYCINSAGTKFSTITSTYTVSGSTLTISGETNLTNDWGEYPYTMTFSGDNTLILSNRLLDDWGQKIVLTRK